MKSFSSRHRRTPVAYEHGFALHGSYGLAGGPDALQMGSRLHRNVGKLCAT